jgi:hypothetical protein
MLVMGLINSSIPRLSKASTIAKMLKLIPDSKPKPTLIINLLMKLSALTWTLSDESNPNKKPKLR